MFSLQHHTRARIFICAASAHMGHVSTMTTANRGGGGVFDIACLNEQSRNNDGHEGSSDGVLSDYPTVHCGIL